MENYFVNVVLLSLMASTLGNFWTLCLVDGMIFGKLGSKMRYRVECEKDDCNGMINDLRWYIKLIKGLGCPFCVTIWIIVVVHIFFYWLMSVEELTVMQRLRTQIRSMLDDPLIARDGLEVQFRCDHELKYSHLIDAITAVSAYRDNSKSEIRVVPLVTRLNLLPPVRTE